MDIGAIHGGASPSYERFQQRTDARVKGDDSRRSGPLIRVAVRCSNGGEGEAPVPGLVMLRSKRRGSPIRECTVRTVMVIQPRDTRPIKPIQHRYGINGILCMDVR
jgi:hypothetical protein